MAMLWMEKREPGVVVPMPTLPPVVAKYALFETVNAVEDANVRMDDDAASDTVAPVSQSVDVVALVVRPA